MKCLRYFLSFFFCWWKVYNKYNHKVISQDTTLYGKLNWAPGIYSRDSRYRFQWNNHGGIKWPSCRMKPAYRVFVQ